MEKRNYSNSKPKGRFQSNERQNRERLEKKPVRRRVNVDRDTMCIVKNNSFGQFFYDNSRMTERIDMEKHGDETEVSVSDLRAMVNSGRKNLEGFSIIITEVLDPEYTLEDVLGYLGLTKIYDELYALSNGDADPDAIKNFIQRTSAKKFKEVMESMSPKLRAKVIETSVKLFKLDEFGDYTKMKVIEGYVNEDLFDDAEESEIDDEIEI
ncbi:hypothetical protein CN553_12430 [Bacillus cereus]|uniref:Uncharacterized protein n=1 Tax=Bacillus cereus TaxID=1396 RepID=A0A9X6UBY9_BACCE|nr:hypothetical protein [Bacillus cereus]PEN97836.1 hypothetical protein CN553_12430 [Bacillus cereus]